MPELIRPSYSPRKDQQFAQLLAAGQNQAGRCASLTVSRISGRFGRMTGACCSGRGECRCTARKW